MVRIAKQTDPKKLEELKKKIRDKKYIEVAITEIAQTITKELLQIED